MNHLNTPSCLKRISITLLTAFTSLSLVGCGTMTGIPSHGGGKRFATEQRLVSASIRSSLKDIDLSPLRGKKVAMVFDIIADEGGGTLNGGRFNLLGGLTAGYLASPATAAASAFQLFNLNDSGTSYTNSNAGGSNTANTTFVTNGTGSSKGSFNQTGTGSFNQTNNGTTSGTNANNSNGSFSQNQTGSNTSTGAFSQNQAGTNTSNTNMTGSSNGTSTDATTGTIAGTSNGTSSSAYQQAANTTGSGTSTASGTNTGSGTNTSTVNGTNINSGAGSFTQTNSGTSSGANTSDQNGSNSNTSANASTGNNLQNGNFNQTGNQNGGFNSSHQAISNQPSYTITQTKGIEQKRGVSLDYKGLGEYQNMVVPKSDAGLLMGLVRNYMLLNHVTPTTPEDKSADAIMYVTVDIFGIVRSRFDAYIYNQETLKAETSFEMIAFDRNGQMVLAPRNANREAQYAERYLLWAGPFVTSEKVRKGPGLLIDFSDVDGEHKTYGAEKINMEHPLGKN